MSECPESQLFGRLIVFEATQDQNTATEMSYRIFVGSVLGGQLSDDIGGLFGFADSNGAIATVISYALIIAACLTVAAIASVILQKVVDVLLLGWADKLAGVGAGASAATMSR